MSRKKLRRFAELATLPNVITGQVLAPDFWQKFFGNKRPIILELGCGKGEYTVGLARLHPDNNYIGIDIQGERIWSGAKTALTEGLTNVAFIRGSIEQLTDYVPARAIAEIWLTFPDPYPRDRQAKKRLTSPRFLALYKKVLQPRGVVHLKTDARALFDYTLTTLVNDGAIILEKNTAMERSGIETTFERKHRALGEPIYYLAWRWPL